MLEIWVSSKRQQSKACLKIIGAHAGMKLLCVCVRQREGVERREARTSYRTEPIYMYSMQPLEQHRLFVWAMHGWVGYFTFLFLKLHVVCYAHVYTFHVLMYNVRIVKRLHSLSC